METRRNTEQIGCYGAQLNTKGLYVPNHKEQYGMHQNPIQAACSGANVLVSASLYMVRLLIKFD